MDIKKFQKSAVDFGEKLSRELISKRNFPVLLRLLSYPAKFFAAFFLSRAIILGDQAPFGLAFAAAVGTSAGSTLALMGTSLGYLSILSHANSLKYIACVILIYTAHFVFKNTSIAKHKLFTPLSALIPIICINFVFIAEGGFALLDTVTGVTEVFLVTACAFLFRLLLFREKKAEAPPLFPFALLTLFAALLIPLTDITIFSAVSVGRTLALLLTALTAFGGGIGCGACVGVVTGCAVGLATSSAEYCMVASLAGITAGFFAKKGRILTAAAFFTASAAAIMWINPSAAVPMISESLVALLIFTPIAELFAAKMRVLMRPRFTVEQSDRIIRVYASERLSNVSTAFRRLGGMLSGIFEKSPEPDSCDISAVYDRTVQQLCKKCKLSQLCWERDYSTTKTALNDASAAIRKRGVLKASDFPMYFSSRCISIDKFVNTANRELSSSLYRRQCKSKIDESRDIICAQYANFADIFSELAAELTDTRAADDACENRMRDALAARGILCDTAVYRDCGGHLKLHLCGRDLRAVAEDFEKNRAEFADMLGFLPDTPEYTHGEQLDDLIICELPALRVRVGSAVHRRAGSELSGDSGSFFKLQNGKLAVILSDGMGSGRAAATESASAISLLEGLLKSGIHPKKALSALNSALILKTEETGAFATLDLLYADLFTGETQFYKLGGAPTYIKRGKHIRRIASTALPAGISTGKSIDIDSVCVTLAGGDCVVMASDGIADASDDRWLMELLSNAELSDVSPKALAGDVLAHALTKYGRADDMTVIAFYIEHSSVCDV